MILSRCYGGLLSPYVPRALENILELESCPSIFLSISRWFPNLNEGGANTVHAYVFERDFTSFDVSTRVQDARRGFLIRQKWIRCSLAVSIEASEKLYICLNSRRVHYRLELASSRKRCVSPSHDITNNFGRNAFRVKDCNETTWAIHAKWRLYAAMEMSFLTRYGKCCRCLSCLYEIKNVVACNPGVLSMCCAVYGVHVVCAYDKDRRVVFVGCVGSAERGYRDGRRRRSE